MTFVKTVIILVTAFFIASCSNGEDDAVISKTPKAVPGKYYNATDPAFSHHQDTLLYNNKLFSGWVYGLFPAGDTVIKIGYVNGLQEGICRKWYLNKQLCEERLYINGKKEGIHKGWWDNGKPKFLFEVSNDEYTGMFKEWYNSGLIARDFHYKNGQEEGNEKMWWPDGTIRANYVIKDGQKFGLFGQRLCANSNLTIK